MKESSTVRIFIFKFVKYVLIFKTIIDFSTELYLGIWYYPDDIASEVRKITGRQTKNYKIFLVKT